MPKQRIINARSTEMAALSSIGDAPNSKWNSILEHECITQDRLVWERAQKYFDHRSGIARSQSFEGILRIFVGIAARQI